MFRFIDIYSLEIDFFFFFRKTKRCYGNLNLSQGKKARKGRQGEVKTKKNPFQLTTLVTFYQYSCYFSQKIL